MTNPLPLGQWLNAPRPDNTPVAWLDDRTWTLGQLRHDVTLLVETLRQQEGERWALCFENSYLFIVALLASLHAGKTPVIPGHSRVSQLEEQQSLFSGVLSDRTLGFHGKQIVVASSHQTASHWVPLPAIDENRFVELFTSGSTGTPRRVVKHIVSLDREARLLANRFGERLAGCSIVASVVPQHLYGLTFRIVLPMALGLPLHAAMLYYAEQLAALPPDRQYLFISSPAFLKRLDTELAAPPVRMLISAGGMLPWRDVSTTSGWLNLWPDEIYGSTETGILAWRHRQEDNVPWLPFPGVIFHQEDDACRVTSPLIHEPEGLQLDDILHFDSEGLFSIAGGWSTLKKNASRLTRSNAACWSSTVFAKRPHCRSRAGVVRGLAPCWFWMKRPVSAGMCRIKKRRSSPGVAPCCRGLNLSRCRATGASLMKCR